ncbi:hypothetical protein JZU46_00660 [bacterium]|nr:hypothetical protein [bacterium]
MTIAHDIHAEMNPVYCAAVLAKFCEAHQQGLERKPALVTAYLVLPIALSDDLAVTFDGCNINTGLRVWIERNPNVLLDLAERVNSTLPVTTEAIRFGCIAKLLQIEKSGEIGSLNMKISPAILDGNSGKAFKRARLLGSWFSGTGSARAVIEAMGVSV